MRLRASFFEEFFEPSPFDVERLVRFELGEVGVKTQDAAGDDEAG